MVVARWSLALAISLAVGCGKPRAIARPGPPPTAAVLFAHLQRRAAQIHSLRSEAKVDYLQEKGERIKMSMTFLSSHSDEGDALRVQGEGPLGGSVVDLASDGKRFQLLDIRANRFLEGEATPCNLARLFQLRLGTRDLVAILGGGAPLIGEPAEVRWDPNDGGREVLVLRGEGTVETVMLSPVSWDVVAAEIAGSDGKVLYRVEQEDFELHGAVRYPKRIQIFDPIQHADAKIRFRSREPNVALAPNVFRLQPPQGIAPEEVRCE